MKASAPEIPPRDAFDWQPSRRWICPRCTAELVTREAAPRCSRCGVREDE